MTQAINDRFPAPFEGVAYDTARDIVNEALSRTSGDDELITEQLLWDIRCGVDLCPECEGPLGLFEGDQGDHYTGCTLKSTDTSLGESA